MFEFLRQNYEASPYPEVKIRAARAANVLSIGSPWMEIEVEFDQETSSVKMDWLALHEYPLVQLIAKGRKSPFSGVTPATPIDLNFAIEATRVGSSYDSMMLFTLLRLKRLRFLQTSPDHRAFARRLPFLTKAGFIHALQQTHYVTLHASAALFPALETFVEAKDLILKFIKAEKGHDRLMKKALKALDAEPDLNAVLPATRSLMELLQKAARKNPTAFSVLVSAFESDPFSEEDPLARALIDAGFVKAAAPVDQHHQINREDGHAMVGLEFLTRRPAISKAELCETFAMLQDFEELSSQMVRELK